MYPHQQFVEVDEKFIKKFVELFPLATLILTHEEEIYTSHVPLIWKEKCLLGHIDLNNPMAKMLNNKQAVNVIFHGPENYISPGHFTTSEFPTYNYMKVEIKAKAIKMSKDELRASIIEMTHLLDQQFPNNLNGKEERMEKTMNYIYGFQLKVCSYSGRFKMSQDKSKSHFFKALQVLKNGESKRHKKILQLFSVFENKKNV